MITLLFVILCLLALGCWLDHERRNPQWENGQDVTAVAEALGVLKDNR